MVRWFWVNFQCRGVLLVWKRVGHGPTALAVGVGGGCLDIFTHIYPFSFLSPSLWETTRYRLKYCLKGSLSPKTTNQPNSWGGRMVRWCWVNFQCRGVLLILTIVWQAPTALAVGVGEGCLDIFCSLVYHFSFLSPSLWETARYRLE